MVFGLRRILVCAFSAFLFYSCGSSNKAIYRTAYEPYKDVQGRVTDESSGEPVEGAGIRVEGTTLAAQTTEDGTYSLSVPFGYYELSVYREGYDPHIRSIYLPAEESGAEFNVKLTEIPDPAGAYESNAYTDEESEYGAPEDKRVQELEEQVDSLEQVISDLRLRLNDDMEEIKIESGDKGAFIKHFIGDEMNCKVLNPDNILFDENDDETLIRLAGPVQLEILNKELGYRITVDLEKYVSKDYGEILGVDSEAEYYFEELVPGNMSEAERWKKNREKYFAGSLRHFLIAMSGEKSPFSYGYRLYSGTFVSKTSAMAYSSSSASDIEVVPADVLVPYTGENTSIFNFEGELRVEYIKRGVDDPHNIMGLDTYPYQTSWISLNQKLVEFTKNGTFENPELVQVTGVWRYTPVCQMLPDDYLPGNPKNEAGK